MPILELLYTKRNSIIVLSACFFEYLFIYALLPIVFETNDDEIMNKIASGAMTGNPSEYLIFMNVVIGKMLKFLYTILPNVNWYTWFLFLANFLSYSAIQYSFNKLKVNIWIKIIQHLIIFNLFILAFVYIQFTKVASLAIVSGIVLILFSNFKKKYEIGLGIALIFMGALIRSDVLLMYILLSFPFLFYLAVKKHQKHLFVIISTFAISLLFVFYSYFIYSNNKEFSNYSEFNAIRSKITTHDNPNFTYNNKKLMLEKVGWTQNDFTIASFFNLDIGHEKFEIGKLKYLIDENKRTFFEKTFSKEMLISGRSAISQLKYYLVESFKLLLFVFLLMLVLEKKLKEFLIFFLTFLYVGLISFILVYYFEGALKERVLFGLTIPILLFIPYYFNFSINLSQTLLKYIRYILLLLSVTFFIYLSIQNLTNIYNTKLSQLKRIEKGEIYNHFFQNQNEDFYVSWLPLSYDIFKLPYSEKKIYSLGWLAGSPFNKDKIHRYTDKKNNGIYCIVNKNIIWYFSNDKINQTWRKSVKEFYKANYTNVSIEEKKNIFLPNDTIYKTIIYIQKK